MNESSDRPGSLSRRDLIKGAALAGMGLATGTYGVPEALGDPTSSGPSTTGLPPSSLVVLRQSPTH